MLFAKGTLSLILGQDLHQATIDFIKDNWEVARGWGKDSSELAMFAAQFVLVAGVGFIRTMPCWMNMLGKPKQL